MIVLMRLLSWVSVQNIFSKQGTKKDDRLDSSEAESTERSSYEGGLMASSIVNVAYK